LAAYNNEFTSGTVAAAVLRWRLLQTTNSWLRV